MYSKCMASILYTRPSPGEAITKLAFPKFYETNQSSILRYWLWLILFIRDISIKRIMNFKASLIYLFSHVPNTSCTKCDKLATFYSKIYATVRHIRPFLYQMQYNCHILGQLASTKKKRKGKWNIEFHKKVEKK